MHFNQINSFYLVATLGTYQAAAERLHATQPAISSRIAALEDSLNVKLFDRSGYRVSLTPQGRRFLPYAEKMLELQSEATVAVSDARDLTGIVRIGISDTMVASWFPDFLIDLRKSHPGITVEMFVRGSPHLQDDLTANSTDIAFLVGTMSNPSVIARDFCTCDMGFVAAPELGLHGRPLQPADLSNLHFFTFEKVSLPYPQLVHALKSHGISANLNAITSLHSIKLLTRKGLGVGYLPLVALREDLSSGRLVRLDPPFDLPSLPFSVCYNDGPQKHIAQIIANAAGDFVRDWSGGDSIKISY